MKAELCKSCIHTKVCMNDKNLFGDVYVAPNPSFFSPEYRQRAWERFKEREAKGFPCEDYSQEIKHGKWIWDDEGFHCSECWHHAQGNTYEVLSGDYRYCPHCGAIMEKEN